MNEQVHANIKQMQSLDAEGRHGELLAFLQQLYRQAEEAPAPARTDYFMTMFQWRLLIEKYAPAADALAQARDEQARRLLAGDLYAGTAGSSDDDMEMFERVRRFSLISEMNETLGDPGATHALFLQLEQRRPELARRYAWQALPDIVEVGDFALADRHRGDPLELLGEVNDAGATLLLFPAGHQAPRLAGALTNLTRAARLGIATLRGLGRDAEAGAIRESLLSGLENGELRALAERELEEPGTITRMLVEHQMAQEDASRAA